MLNIELTFYKLLIIETLKLLYVSDKFKNDREIVLESVKLYEPSLL